MICWWIFSVKFLDTNIGGSFIEHEVSGRIVDFFYPRNSVELKIRIKIRNVIFHI